MSQYYEIAENFLPAEGGHVGVTKYKSKTSKMTVYFADIDAQVINGYFCFGTEQPETSGIEQLINHLDSSGGLLPRPMRGDMLRPAWQFHGAENPLADRDQSCFVCSALGEPAFLGTFSCSVYLLQNIDAVLELHGYPYKSGADKSGDEAAAAAAAALAEGKKEEGAGEAAATAIGELSLDENSNQPKEVAEDAGVVSEEEDDGFTGPALDKDTCYCLSESGEGAMAWEATLQAMFPSCPAFWNRLLSDGRSHRLSSRLRRCYDKLYRPDNLCVIVTGTVKNKEHILDVLHDHENDFTECRPETLQFEKPWATALEPAPSTSVINAVQFIPRNLARSVTNHCTVCLGWRGCPSTDLEKSMAMKVITAHFAVGPMWTKIVTAGHAHRISWCQLEYKDACSLITIHGIKGEEMADRVLQIATETVNELLGSEGTPGSLAVNEIRAMADRVGWHYIRELESEPFLMVASAIAKAERYGEGDQEQLRKRMRPRLVFDKLLEQPREYWIDIIQKMFKENPMFATKVVPKARTPEQQIAAEGGPKGQEESSGDMPFSRSSKRAASRPRRRSENPVGQETNVAVDDEGRSASVLPAPEAGVSEIGLLEEHLLINPFPFGNFETERAEFENRLQVTKGFLDDVTKGEFKSWTLSSFNSESETQHELFPLVDLPLYVFLEDTESSFVYLTVVFDTTHLTPEQRKYLSPVTAALGAFVCPRPPGLDTDAEITDPNEFNPPMDIADSQVSIGLNGEMMQSVFLTVIVRPEKYAWAVGLISYIMSKVSFTPNFLKFVAAEAARGLAANYKMQTAEKPNYDCFDSVEINLHSVIKQVYKLESNARLFVGRRRLDIMMEFLTELEKDPEGATAKTNDVWQNLVKTDKVVVQVATNVKELKKRHDDLVAPWKSNFAGMKKPLQFSKAQPNLEPTVMNELTGTGTAVTVNQPRLPCLSIAAKINPHSDDFPKICMASQLFSMAQKWIWSCWDLDDFCSPVIRMPCSYANLMTLNLESYDVIGSLKTMKKMILEDWSWVGPLLIATKLMVVNDPACLEVGAQGTIASALLSHLAGQSVEVRKDLLKRSMDVTLEDIQYVMKTYLAKFFDPNESCCALMASDPVEKEKLTARLTEMGYKMEPTDLHELCKNL